MIDQLVPLESVHQLQIEMGLLCNLRCVMCYQGNYQHKMPRRIWSDALVPIYPHLLHVFVGGGEPTVLPETSQLIERIVSQNHVVRFGTSTNGMLFDEYWRETFVRHGRDVSFSLNGATRDVHEAINVGSKFDRVMDNLQRLIELRDQKHAKLRIQISTVIIPENAHEIFAFLRLGKRLGVDVRYHYDTTRIPAADPVIDTQVLQAVEFAAEFDASLRIAGLDEFYSHYRWLHGIENPLIRRRTGGCPKCTIPWTALHVDRLGMVRLCCMTNLFIGDLNKEGIEQIWNSDKARSLRRGIARGDYRFCEPHCPSNASPTYIANRAKLAYYLKKFSIEFGASPRLACRKAIRRARQLAVPRTNR